MDFEFASRRDPNNADAYANRGILHYNRGVLKPDFDDFEQAIINAKRACELGDCDLLLFMQDEKNKWILYNKNR
ncbi:hypothetical protein AGMMS50229_03700 [Campylobacterota bacterium]|nr:hypothetical protein AGMMS50229_03700 [Campylobacterota bacterium]